jgi:hypothetical protein
MIENFFRGNSSPMTLIQDQTPQFDVPENEKSSRMVVK